MSSRFSADEREFLSVCAVVLETEGYGARARSLRRFAKTGVLS